MADAWSDQIAKDRPASADVFSKCQSARLDDYRAAERLGLVPYYREMASQSGPVVEHDGQPVIMLGSNNYLGLTGDERVKRGAIEAVERYGTGCTGSRLMNGTLSLHRELEDELADWMGTEAALVFTAGYLANVGLLSTLVETDDAVFLDSAGHASLIDGARLCNGVLRSFRHNLPSSLHQRLRTWREKHPSGGALVAVDGIYSMEGDRAPVAEIAAVCGEAGARLLVDEAHALGVLGPEGAGVAAADGVAPDLLMGTFSKSLASCGGFIAGPAAVIDYLRITCRPLLFTASGVPAALGAALAATRIARQDSERRETVLTRATELHGGLLELGFAVGPAPEGPIIPIHVGGDWPAARLWRKLLDLGVYTNCAMAPAVPAGRALLRTSVMATHTPDHIHAVLNAFEEARSTLD
jgi:8-amino-7-oxononanoate synthase